MTFEETLPDEILLEIFEYLHPTEILLSFTNLNSRFNGIISDLIRNVRLTRILSLKSYQYLMQTILPSISSSIECLTISNDDLPCLTTLFLDYTDRLSLLSLRKLSLYYLSTNEIYNYLQRFNEQCPIEELILHCSDVNQQEQMDLYGYKIAQFLFYRHPTLSTIELLGDIVFTVDHLAFLSMSNNDECHEHEMNWIKLKNKTVRRLTISIRSLTSLYLLLLNLNELEYLDLTIDSDGNGNDLNLIPMLPMSTLHYFQVKTKNCLLKFEHVEDFLKMFPSVRSFGLEIFTDDRRFFNGQSFERLLTNVDQLNLSIKSRSKSTIEERSLSTFYSRFWIEEKHWSIQGHWTDENDDGDFFQIYSVPFRSKTFVVEHCDEENRLNKEKFVEFEQVEDLKIRETNDLNVLNFLNSCPNVRTLELNEIDDDETNYRTDDEEEMNEFDEDLLMPIENSFPKLVEFVRLKKLVYRTFLKENLPFVERILRQSKHVSRLSMAPNDFVKLMRDLDDDCRSLLCRNLKFIDVQLETRNLSNFDISIYSQLKNLRRISIMIDEPLDSIFSLIRKPLIGAFSFGKHFLCFHVRTENVFSSNRHFQRDGSMKIRRWIKDSNKFDDPSSFHIELNDYFPFSRRIKMVARERNLVRNYSSRVPQWKRIDQEIQQLTKRYDQIDPSAIDKFNDFPLSQRTLEGLETAGFIQPTDIQREAIGVALKGHDILGAAMTGSGKTLAFLIPVLECLYRFCWTMNDGLGVLIISPTRELAYQTFEVLKKIGHKHDFSAGLIIGGKDLKGEQERISRTNIVVCTPGRLLQHFDETWNFSCENLKMLIIDEADRTLDLGFAETMRSIVSNLPEQRQTMLFSATQTKSIRELALVSLKKPVYISVHEKSNNSTPNNLTQSYVICEAEQKLSLLWSFIKNHLKSKMIVFIQSCKQVKFLNDVICKLRPGLPVMALYGSMGQVKRMSIYDTFCRKQYACLLATDIAARGLDFPSINWVIQFDCPPDANTYIHRVGRTARFQHNGEALLFLTAREEPGMIKQLQDKKVPINKIEVNSNFVHDLTPKLQALCAQFQELKEQAKRAFTAYLRSLLLIGNRKVFDVHSINVEAYSKSLGLEIMPRVRFMKKNQKASVDDKTEIIDERKDEVEDEDEDDWFKVKKDSETLEQFEKNKEEMNEEKKEKKKGLTRSKAAKKIRKKNILINQRVEFDENGNAIVNSDGEDPSSSYNIEEAKARLQEADRNDKETYRAMIKQKHKERRIKEKEARRAAREARRATRIEEENSESNDEKQEENSERKRSLSPVEKETKKKKKVKDQRLLTELIDQDATKSIVDTEKLALYLLSK